MPDIICHAGEACGNVGGPLERDVAFRSLATANANVDLGEYVEPVFGLRGLVAGGLQPHRGSGLSDIA